MSFMSVLLWILGGLLALLVLLLVLPVGVQVCYDASGFTLRLAAGPVRWQLLPSRSGWLWRKLQKKPEAPPARQAAPAPKAEPKKAGPGRSSDRICRFSVRCWAMYTGACWCGAWCSG